PQERREKLRIPQKYSILRHLRKEYDNCIVGAGLSRSVIAENYASHFGQTSLIIEKRNHYRRKLSSDYIDMRKPGIRVSLFGVAFIPHSTRESVGIHSSEWVPYEHKVLGMVNGKLVPIPVTIDTVNILFEDIKTTKEMDEFMKKERVPLVDKKGKPREAVNSEEVALANVGNGYDLSFKLLSTSPPSLVPRYWQEFQSERPATDLLLGSAPGIAQRRVHILLWKMLNNSKITVVTNTDYLRLDTDTLLILGWPKLTAVESGIIQQFEDVNGTKVDYTRIVEYKHLLNQTSNHTIYVIERSKDGGEPYYPVPNQENKDLHKKYQDMADKEEGVTTGGWPIINISTWMML
ncbi:LOW QUALITY PROTEIN: hypothetical protein ACHAW5_005286, partial [Stephanodiscus triporus]